MSGTSSTVGCQAPFPPPYVPASLIGVPQATLQAWLAAAQTALQGLMIGQSLVRVEYAEGQGHRVVLYKAADAAGLNAWISLLNQALGQGRPRRALRPRF